MLSRYTKNNASTHQKSYRKTEINKSTENIVRLNVRIYVHMYSNSHSNVEQIQRQYYTQLFRDTYNTLRRRPCWRQSNSENKKIYFVCFFSVVVSYPSPYTYICLNNDTHTHSQHNIFFVPFGYMYVCMHFQMFFFVQSLHPRQHNTRKEKNEL